MDRAVLRRIGLITAAVCCIALGLAFWLLPGTEAGGTFDTGDRVTGVGLIAAGALLVVWSLVAPPGARSDAGDGADRA